MVTALRNAFFPRPSRFVQRIATQCVGSFHALTVNVKAFLHTLATSCVARQGFAVTYKKCRSCPHAVKAGMHAMRHLTGSPVLQGNLNSQAMDSKPASRSHGPSL